MYFIVIGINIFSGYFAKTMIFVSFAKYQIINSSAVFSSLWELIIMTGTTIAVPTNFMTQVQSIVDGFINTLQAWFPDLLLISLLVGLVIFAINWISRKVKASGKGH